MLSLKDLRPPELLLIWDPQDVRKQTLFQATLLDLALRGVLKVEKNGKGKYALLRISRGGFFKYHDARKYEIKMLDIFREAPDLTVSPNQLYNLFRTEGLAKEFKYDFMLDGPLAKCFQPLSSWELIRLFQKFRLNETGEKLRLQIWQIEETYGPKVKDGTISESELEALQELMGPTGLVILQGFGKKRIRHLLRKISKKRQKSLADLPQDDQPDLLEMETHFSMQKTLESEAPEAKAAHNAGIALLTLESLDQMESWFASRKGSGSSDEEGDFSSWLDVDNYGFGLGDQYTSSSSSSTSFDFTFLDGGADFSCSSGDHGCSGCGGCSGCVGH